MRNFLLITAIAWLLVTSCRSDQTIGPPDLLYRQWHLLRSRDVTKSDWHEGDIDGIYTVEYRADGTLIYRRDGVQIHAGCCRPTQFNRQGMVINYTSWQLCYTALCATTNRVTINQLTDRQLELTDGYTVSQYESVN